MTKDQKVTAWGLYCQGVMGMARDENPDSGNSQFFFMRWPYPSLERKYTAWGRVISGLDVVRAIKTGEPVEDPQDRMEKGSRARRPAGRPSRGRKVRVIDPKGLLVPGRRSTGVRAAKGADFPRLATSKFLLRVMK